MYQLQQCPLCHSQITSTNHRHISQECSMRSAITHQGKAYFICNGTQYYCFRCLQEFNQSAWETHGKKIRKLCPKFSDETEQQDEHDMGVYENRQETIVSTPTRQTSKNDSNQKLSTESRKIRNARYGRFSENDFYSSSIKLVQRFSEYVQLTQDQKLVLLFIQIFIAKSKVIILDWIKSHRMINPVHLHKFFNNYVDKTLNLLRHTIKQPTYDMLNQSMKAKWSTYLDQPSDIFDRQKIIDRTEKLAPTLKLKLRRCLNSIYKRQYFQIFQQLPVDFYKPKYSRDKRPIKPIDLFDVLEELFYTKERGMVHVALDFMLIFQSAIRFDSDQQNLRKGVLEMLEKRKKGENCFGFEILINKTGKKIQIILGQQLCRLLQLFGWNRFYPNDSLFQRSVKIFGFPIYALKRGVLSEYTLQQTKNFNLDIKALVGHSCNSTTGIYTMTAQEVIRKQIKDKLFRIPHLKIESVTREQLVNGLGKSTAMNHKYVSILKGWLERLRSHLVGYDKTEIDFCWPERPSASNDNQKMQAQQSSKMKLVNEGQEQNEGYCSEEVINSVIILGKYYSYQENKFNFLELYQQSMSGGKCKKCHEEATVDLLLCSYCTSLYHKKCTPRFCFCTTTSYPIFEGIKNSSQSVYEGQIKMPQNYFGSQQQNINLNQIKFLIIARRFYYTTTLLQPFPLQNCSHLPYQETRQIKMSKFSEYQEGRYFPPLQLGISGYETLSGTGFGLFAAQSIEKNCFIGQYAADVLNSSFSIRVRRPDSIFNLLEMKNSEGILIGPVFHCSYACLLNTSINKQPNCVSLKAIINGSLRVIIITKRSINKGQQLCYEYSPDQKSYNIQQIAKPTLISHHQQQQAKKRRGLGKKRSCQHLLQKNPQNKECGLYNNSQSCYMNSVFQLIKILNINFVRKENVSKILFNLFQKMQNTQVALNPIDYHQYFKRISNNKFDPDQQNDTHQFLTFILDNLEVQTKTLFEIKISSFDTCLACQASKINNIQCLTYNIEPTQKRLLELFTGQYASVIEQFCCDSCHSKTSVKRNEIVAVYPEFLIVHLERYITEVKNKQPINYHWIGTTEYTLAGAIIHEGDVISSGHYFALKTNSPTNNTIYNDQNIRNSSQLFEEDCYLLIYKKASLFKKVI